jgi:hypothetical protein
MRVPCLPRNFYNATTPAVQFYSSNATLGTLLSSDVERPFIIVLKRVLKDKHRLARVMLNFDLFLSRLLSAIPANQTVAVFLESDLPTTVALVQCAKAIIGVHGAGLLKMIFSPTKIPIFELWNEQESHDVNFLLYRNISEATGQIHHFVQVDVRHEGPWDVKEGAELDRVTETLRNGTEFI